MVDDSLIRGPSPPEDPSPSVSFPEVHKPPQSPCPDDISSLQQELTELKNSFAHWITQNNPSLEQMRQELANTTVQRDEAASELQRLKRTGALNHLAAQYNFCDVEYLDFVLQKHDITPDNQEAVAEFMKDFKQQNPRWFILPVKAGAGSRPGAAPSNIGMPANGNRTDMLEMMLSGAPEIF